MVEADLDTTLRKWGNGVGVFFPAEITRKLRAEPGARVHIHIEYDPPRNNPGNLPTWEGRRSVDIDAILDEDLGA